MDNSPPDCEILRRYDSEDYDTIGDPMSPSCKGKGNDSMVSNITLWQFLLELLLNNNYKHIICFTTNDGEFKLVNAEEVAKLWGMRKNKTNMNYDKLSRALRYYYDKNIIKKVLGQKFVYRFVNFPDVLKAEGKLSYPVKVEPSNVTPKISCGSVSPYSSAGMSHSPISSSAPSPSASGVHNGGIQSPAHHPSPHHLTSPPPAHIGSYPNIGLAAHMYQAAVTHMAAAASLGNYLTAISRRTDSDARSQGSPTPQSHWSPDVTPLPRSPSPGSEDSREVPEVPLHLVSEEATRRRREEEAQERRREEEMKKDRSPLGSPMLSAPLTPPPAKDHKSSSPINKTVNRVRSGPKPKPSPLSIEAITGGPPVVSPRQFSASSLNTPVVSLPSPPYSGVGTKSPGFLPLHFWSTLSPLASLSPHYGSPRSQRHFTFPALPQHYGHLPPPVLSPLIPTSSFDFAALTSPSEKSVPVLQ